MRLSFLLALYKCKVSLEYKFSAYLKNLCIIRFFFFSSSNFYTHIFLFILLCVLFGFQDLPRYFVHLVTVLAVKIGACCRRHQAPRCIKEWKWETETTSSRTHHLQCQTICRGLHAMSAITPLVRCTMAAHRGIKWKVIWAAVTTSNSGVARQFSPIEGSSRGWWRRKVF